MSARYCRRLQCIIPRSSSWSFFGALGNCFVPLRIGAEQNKINEDLIWHDWAKNELKCGGLSEHEREIGGRMPEQIMFST